MNQLETLKNSVLEGKIASAEEVLAISAWPDVDALCEAADEIRRKCCGNKIDKCSIINARSGRCGENCKWCAQSAHFKTGVEEYASVSEEDAMALAKYNESRGVERYSLVTSGRRVTAKEMPCFCEIYKQLRAQTGLHLCASMGLLGREELTMLRECGVERYHCNMETAPSYFPELCNTHTPDDKIRTIKIAKELGMSVCSGGIIGMGETMAQRIELAVTLRELGGDSVPINILNPIPGTALENQPLISEDEIIRTVAAFRFILPSTPLRFAGGRARLSDAAQRRILRGGMNGVLMGDMLTTIGNRIDQDNALFAELGFE